MLNLAEYRSHADRLADHLPWAALVAPVDEIAGRYCEDCRVAEPSTNPEIRQGVRPYALNPDTARALWAKSEEMVGEKFG